ncbi:MAG: DUF4178 domain-containing protein [Nitrospirae bacterium]|nr:DUF4178 domain-containing protein [Nitrospirota bacterium]
MRFSSAQSLLAVCGYCRATLMRRDLDVENVGKMAELIPDPTPLQLGVEGKYRGTHFAVAGRIQVEYPDGAWNEWFLFFDDGKTGWLGEACGTYMISFEKEAKEPLPAWESLTPGTPVVLNGRSYGVSDVRTARVVGGEGELPFRVAGGYEARVADLRTDSEAFATIDYSDEAPRVFVGEAVEFGSLDLNGLREFEGW